MPIARRLALTAVVSGLALVAPMAAAQDVTWETLPELMELAEANGFSGSILAVRDGEVVLDAGYGHADPDGEHPVTPHTLFAIGSTPIDFTHAAILALEEMGKLSLDDPIGEHLDHILSTNRFGMRVPRDKRSITLEHLRTGRSGLYDFPGIPGVDENTDLSRLSRDEFLIRVMGSELLFEPGASERHSHAAWGLLAAIVEITSGQEYEAFLREHFFGPAGMERTGHYPHSKGFDASEVAVGLGGNVWGEVNAPTHWGETSWLVLGSGGMVSTPRDLHRWREFLRGGEVLGAESLKRYGVEGPNMNEGGNDRGFINTIGSRGDSIVIVCSNSHTAMGDFASEVANAAAEVGARGGGAGSGEQAESAEGESEEGGMVTDRGPRPGVDFELKTDAFVLQPLHPRHVEMDYKACMDNREHLRASLGWGGWPQDDMTLEGDRGDLERHYGEFERDEAYAFAVLAPSLEEITGCVYIDRAPDDPAAVSVAWWVVERELANDLDRQVLDAVLELLPEWGFERAAVPILKSYERGMTVAEEAGLEPFPSAGGNRTTFVWQARG